MGLHEQIRRYMSLRGPPREPLCVPDEISSGSDYKTRRLEVVQQIASDKSRPAKPLEFDSFLMALRTALTRAIKRILILALFGESRHWGSIAQAIAFIESFDVPSAAGPFVRFEICVRYTNGDEVRNEFQEQRSPIDFLRALVVSQGSR